MEIHHGCLKHFGHDIVNLPLSGYQVQGQVLFIVYFTLSRYQVDGSVFNWTVVYAFTLWVIKFKVRNREEDFFKITVFSNQQF